MEVPEEAKKLIEEMNREPKFEELLEWHERHEGEVFCPFCGVDSGEVRTNGKGFYRCMGKCEQRFVLLRCTEDDNPQTVAEGKKEK